MWGEEGMVFSCARRQHSFGLVLRTESESLEQSQVCSSCWEMLSIASESLLRVNPFLHSVILDAIFANLHQSPWIPTLFTLH